MIINWDDVSAYRDEVYIDLGQEQMQVGDRLLEGWVQLWREDWERDPTSTRIRVLTMIEGEVERRKKLDL
jgi:hypothetical protein